ncbi:hypothetical protein [Actinomadura atramentaria]|uniref:hypothetical protein n=1 Tax=Actinomadura atramentaria TaxID=1990 RepID=UPI00036AA951|nr:hypothetical protein [Actinomadura atramentaria]
MADQFRIHVNGSPQQALQQLEQTLQPEGFRITWEQEGQQGFLERGTRLKALLLGVIATHYKYRLIVHPQADGTVVLDIGLGNTGLSGGALGVAKVRKRLGTVRDQLIAAYQANGVLIGA